MAASTKPAFSFKPGECRARSYLSSKEEQNKEKENKNKSMDSRKKKRRKKKQIKMFETASVSVRQ